MARGAAQSGCFMFVKLIANAASTGWEAYVYIPDSDL